MSTKWVVTTAAERLELDETHEGGTTFTVTNPGKAADRVVFEPVPGTGADPSWFTVEEPQRRVLPAASVSFLLKAAIPAQAKPGTYEVQGRVYSADSAPEESSVLSGRVVFEVAAPAAPVKRKVPWWIYAVAAALVLITVVTVALVLTSGPDDPPAAKPSTAVTVVASGPVKVPTLAGLSEAQAGFALKDKGLVLGTVKHRHDAGRVPAVVEQSVPADQMVAAGTVVDLVATVKLTAPTPKPTAAAIKVLDGRINWEQSEPYVTHWIVSISISLCTQNDGYAMACGGLALITSRTDTKSYAPPTRMRTTARYGVTNVVADGGFAWTVQAVDDFGTPGPASAATSNAMTN